MNLPKLLPQKDWPTAIGKRKSSVYNLIREGRIQALRIGRNTFITEAEAARFRAKEGILIGRQDPPGDADKAT